MRREKSGNNGLNFQKSKSYVEMILLAVLCGGDFYGYQLVQLVYEYSGKTVSIPEGSLYPALYRLEENGSISLRKELVGKRQERIYYHIEPSGREYLNVLIADYNRLHDALRNILHAMNAENIKNI